MPRHTHAEAIAERSKAANHTPATDKRDNEATSNLLENRLTAHMRPSG